MKIEFNGRAVVSFCLGLLVGGIAMGVGLALGPIGRIQRERDDARAAIVIHQQQVEYWKQISSGLSQQGMECNRKLYAFQYPNSAQQSAQPASAPQSQDPAVQVLNMVRPGLGTVVGALANAAQKAQAATPAILSCGADQIAVPLLGRCVTCNPGLHPGTFPNGTAGCVQ